MNWLKFLIFFEIIILSWCGQASSQSIIADSEAVNQFQDISADDFDQVRNYFGTSWPPKIFFGTRSHGRQIYSGLNILEGQNNDLYLQPDMVFQTGLAGQSEGGIFWTDATRAHLALFPETKLVMWAMCRTITGVLSEEKVLQYLNDMNQLELEYPDVFFVYWTDVIDEDGMEGEVEQRNDLIRQFCQDNGKILFDFANITAVNPQGIYYPGTYEGGCTWCEDWCLDNNLSFCFACSECEHTVCFDCYRKGQAFWWLLARLIGWSPDNIAQVGPPRTAEQRMAAYPNPFNPMVNITVDFSHNGVFSLRILDLSGRLVKTLAQDYAYEDGLFTCQWDGRDSSGRVVAAGVYLLLLEAQGQQEWTRIALLR